MPQPMPQSSAQRPLDERCREKTYAYSTCLPRAPKRPPSHIELLLCQTTSCSNPVGRERLRARIYLCPASGALTCFAPWFLRRLPRSLPPVRPLRFWTEAEASRSVTDKPTRKPARPPAIRLRSNFAASIGLPVARSLAAKPLAPTRKALTGPVGSS